MPSRPLSLPTVATTDLDPGAGTAHGFFTRAHARSLGFTDDTLRWRVRSRTWVRLRRDTFITAERFAQASADPRSLHLLHAAAALQRSEADDLTLSHRSAAIAHRLPLLHRWPSHPEITVPRHRRGTLTGTIQHTVRQPLQPDEVTVIDGVPTTSAVRTALTIAGTSTRSEAIVVLDAVLAQGLTTQAALDQAALSTLEGRRRQKMAAALELADGRCLDPLTSLARLALLDHAIPLDEVSVTIGQGRDGQALRVPLLWTKAQVAVIPRADQRLAHILQATGITPVAVDTTTVIHRGHEFAAMIAGLTCARRAA